MATTPQKGPWKDLVTMQAVADGLSATNLTRFASLVVLIAQLRSWIAIYTAVAQARAAHLAALTVRRAIEAEATGFLAGVIAYIKMMLATNNPELLATFGIAQPKARKAASTSTKTIAQAKAAATRAARGTMSKQARQAITANPQPRLIITGIITASPAPAPAAVASAPSIPMAAPGNAATPATTGSTPVTR